MNMSSCSYEQNDAQAASNRYNQSMLQLLDRFQQGTPNPDDIQIFNNIFTEATKDEGFRTGSKSLHARQDRHLAAFVASMRLKNYQDATWRHLTVDEVIQREIRDAPAEEIVSNMRSFLRAQLATMKPRQNSKERPRYKSVEQCRDSLIYWILKERTADNPSRSKLINVANETLHRAAAFFGVDRQPAEKRYFGRFELEDLINWDTIRSPCLAVAESHHLAWCLAAVCNVRPGSIGKSSDYPHDFLSFQHIELLRGSRRGLFNARIEFVHLKGSRNSLGPVRGLKFYVNGATTTEHLPMSIPHRLLVILLRRNGLQSHQSLDSLLDGDEYHIRIKDSMLGQPVCRSGGPRGLSITEGALHASSMTEYLSNRAHQAGYPLGITMYCWRRKAATEWLRTQGMEGAQQMMDHRPFSDTLMRYYDQGPFDVPVFEIAMDVDTTESSKRLREDSHEVLYRMGKRRKEDDIIIEMRSVVYCEEDSTYIQASAEGDVQTIGKRKRRARKIIEKQYHDERRKIHDGNFTVSDLDRRKHEILKPTDLVRLIRDNAQEFSFSDDTLSNPYGEPHNQVEAAQIAMDGYSFDTDSGSDHIASAHTNFFDAEDDIQKHDTGNQSRNTVVTSDANARYSIEHAKEGSEIGFAGSVEFFMAALGQKTFVEEEKAPFVCVLCINNPYFTQELKDRKWASKAKLHNHQLGREHSKEREMIIRFEWERERAEDGLFHCPYAQCEKSYMSSKRLADHIKLSRPPSELTSILSEADRERLQQHDDEKRADGWYDVDFAFDVAQSKPEILSAFRRRGLGLRYSAMQELSMPTKVLGKTHGYEWTCGLGQGPLFREIDTSSDGLISLGDSSSDQVPGQQEFCSRGTCDNVIVKGNNSHYQYLHPTFSIVAELVPNTISYGSKDGGYKHFTVFAASA